MDLRTALDRVFPSARGVEVTVPVEEDGSFLAGIVLPVKHGESVVQIYRYPSTAEDRPRHEHRLSWRHPQKVSFGEGALWAFLVSWDGVASREEIWELVAQRLARNPVLGSSPDAGIEEDRRVTIGDLTVLAALLDVVPDEHRHVTESVLHKAGVATPIIVPLPY